LAARDDMDAGQMHFSAKVEQIQRASDCRNGRRQFDGESGGWVLLWWPWLLGFPGEEARVEDNDVAAFHWTTC